MSRSSFGSSRSMFLELMVKALAKLFGKQTFFYRIPIEKGKFDIFKVVYRGQLMSIGDIPSGRGHGADLADNEYGLRPFVNQKGSLDCEYSLADSLFRRD
ncbi:hypothetical protein VNO80_24887 [Phaseolus coccineus]|uniref:Uncharacterized protein n=1 Tax=Phaseolus coccineus TaxID=3886 RepID=A0AAN9QPL5_PHACN